MKYPAINLELPAWLNGIFSGRSSHFVSLEQKMGLAIHLAKENVKRGGGPFGAAIFDMDTGQLLAPGVNLVVPCSCSVAHAEMMAIMIAQKILGTHDLTSAGSGKYELVSSSEPCAQCYGAIPWSGLRRLVCGAPASVAEEIGFDEGPKADNWVEELENRKIQVVQDVMLEEARAILIEYKENNRTMY